MRFQWILGDRMCVCEAGEIFLMVTAEAGGEGTIKYLATARAPGPTGPVFASETAASREEAMRIAEQLSLLWEEETKDG